MHSMAISNVWIDSASNLIDTSITLARARFSGFESVYGESFDDSAPTPSVGVQARSTRIGPSSPRCASLGHRNCIPGQKASHTRAEGRPTSATQSRTVNTSSFNTLIATCLTRSRKPAPVEEADSGATAKSRFAAATATGGPLRVRIARRSFLADGTRLSGSTSRRSPPFRLDLTSGPRQKDARSRSSRQWRRARPSGPSRRELIAYERLA